MLFNAIKQQIEDLDDGTYSLPRTFEGRCAMLLALSEVAKLVSTSAQPGSTTNRYYDISLFATVGGLMENDYQFLVSNPLPTELEKIRLFSRCMFEYALAITDNQRAALARGYVMQAADNALNATLADSVDKASLLVILYDALRFGATGEYRSEFRKAFILLADEYDPYYGTFASRSRYSLKQSAVVLEGLLAANRFDQQLIDAELSQNLIRGFIEGTYMLSGLVRSAWAPWEFPAHELGLADINYRYPSLPYPLYAGGDNGIAPVFARQIEFISFGGYWNVLDTLSHTPSLMYASDVLMRCNFEAFPEPDIPQYLQ
ncbi:MAG: hypothetical protein U5N86_01950 [Planctomycetota bacterium]|nr:hypothetical protein [Planctomycetota bacterium]